MRQMADLLDDGPGAPKGGVSLYHKRVILENEELISLSEAAAFCGLTHEHLSLLARRGKLEARKIGRDWLTTRAAVEEYMGDAAKRLNDPFKNRR